MAQVIDERNLMTPLSVDDDDERRFKRLLLLLLLLYLLLGIIVPFIQFKEEPPEDKPPPEQVFVKLELEKVVLPPPTKAPEVVTPVEAPPKTETPPPVKKVVDKTPPKAEKIVEAPPGPKVDKEVLALADLKNDLMADLRDSNTSNLGKAGGSSSRNSSDQVARAVIGSNKAGRTSGGIDASSYGHVSTGTGGGGRGSRTQVQSGIPGGGGGGGGSGSGSGSGYGAAGRSEESIRKVMDRNKGKMFSVYNRSLRSNPALRGKFTVKLVIEPSGKVSSIRLMSSQLNDPALEKKLLARVKGINFGPEDVATTTLNYTFDFLPS